jgi:hypothetical protein
MTVEATYLPPSLWQEYDIAIEKVSQYNAVAEKILSTAVWMEKLYSCAVMQYVKNIETLSNYTYWLKSDSQKDIPKGSASFNIIEQVEKVIKAVKGLPTLSGILQTIISLFTKKNVTVDEVVKIVEKDVASSTRILQVVNSAYYGLKFKVYKVRDAIVYLGMNSY